MGKLRLAIWKTWPLKVALMALGWMAIGGSAAASVIAVNPQPFEQQEVDQNRFILVAAPAGEVGFQLLILEQVQDERPCWSESGRDPAIVDPLLLQFDFTDICKRSTDSNGYSLRLAGQDLGLDYSLRILTAADDRILVAMPVRDPQAPPLEIGRTHGLATHFSQIVLNPGWRLTRRTYQGRALGHLYLTNDQPLAALAPMAMSVRSSTSLPGGAIESSPSTSASKPASLLPSSTRPSAISMLPLTGPISLPVPPPESAPTNPPIALPTVTIQTQPATPQWSREASSPRAALPVTPVTLPVPAPPIAASAPPMTAPAIATPSATADDRTLSASAITTPIAAQWYQVVVQADSAELQDQVRAIAPATLMTIVNNQIVIQAGVFRDRQSAEHLKQQFADIGLQAVVLPLP